MQGRLSSAPSGTFHVELIKASSQRQGRHRWFGLCVREVVNCRLKCLSLQVGEELEWICYIIKWYRGENNKHTDREARVIIYLVLSLQSEAVEFMLDGLTGEMVRAAYRCTVWSFMIKWKCCITDKCLSRSWWHRGWLSER